MGDKYIHFSRIMQEKIFITLTHSKECEKLTIQEIKNMTERLALIFPYSEKLAGTPTKYLTDQQANNIMEDGGKIIATEFERYFYK